MTKRPNAKQTRRAKLLAWRFEQYGDISAEELAESLSCENLPWEGNSLPYWVERAVIEFRHLRTDARIAACRAFLKA